MIGRPMNALLPAQSLLRSFFSCIPQDPSHRLILIFPCQCGLWSTTCSAKPRARLMTTPRQQHALYIRATYSRGSPTVALPCPVHASTFHDAFASLRVPILVYRASASHFCSAMPCFPGSKKFMAARSVGGFEERVRGTAPVVQMQYGLGVFVRVSLFRYSSHWP